MLSHLSSFPSFIAASGVDTPIAAATTARATGNILDTLADDATGLTWTEDLLTDMITSIKQFDAHAQSTAITGAGIRAAAQDIAVRLATLICNYDGGEALCRADIQKLAQHGDLDEVLVISTLRKAIQTTYAAARMALEEELARANAYVAQHARIVQLSLNLQHALQNCALMQAPPLVAQSIDIAALLPADEKDLVLAAATMQIHGFLSGKDTEDHRFLPLPRGAVSPDIVDNSASGGGGARPLTVSDSEEEEEDAESDNFSSSSSNSAFMADVHALPAQDADAEKRTKAVQCPSCVQSFSTHAKAWEHMKLAHTDERAYPCLIIGCTATFATSYDRATHGQEHHVDYQLPRAMGPFTCPHCAHVYSMHGNLRRHITHKHSDKQ